MEDLTREEEIAHHAAQIVKLMGGSLVVAFDDDENLKAIVIGEVESIDVAYDALQEYYNIEEWAVPEEGDLQ